MILFSWFLLWVCRKAHPLLFFGTDYTDFTDKLVFTFTKTVLIRVICA